MEESAGLRLRMIASSIAGDARLSVDDCEIRRGGVSYTVDTLADIAARYAPEGKPGLVIGDDLIPDFPDWHRSGEILDLADVIVACRTGKEHPKPAFPCTMMDNDIMEISSSTVRQRIASGGAWRYLIPPAAAAVIEEKGLYGCKSGSPGIPGLCGIWPEGKPLKNIIAKVEAAALENLSFDRFLHSRGTAMLAGDLCRRFSLNPDLGYLAGIAHDLAKQLGGSAQIELAKKYPKQVSDLEKEKPSLLHGWAAAVLLKEHFGVCNSEVLEAVALHTFGGLEMGPVAKAVYIADKAEPSREKIDPALRKLVFCGKDLDAIFFRVLEKAVSALNSRKLKLSQETLALYEKLKNGKAAAAFPEQETRGGTDAG
jgi:nicotinate-nucleotide adenylyltransferase